jgi:aminoglycoside phosphotransferase (APT) family kinase protein
LAVPEINDSTRPVRSGEQLDLERLEPYLREQFPDVDGPLVIEQFPAGHSNLTYFVGLGPLELVLRRPPFGSKVKSAHDMGREYRVLSKLHKAYAPAPEPLLYCEDESILGAPFYAMRRIRGVILRRDPPAGLEITPDTARQMGLSFVDNLATLHGLDYEGVGLADLGKPAGYMERQVAGWIKRYAGSQTDEIPQVEKVSDWLVKNLPPENGATLIHNDYKYDNVILDSQDLTRIIGVLDWEMATIGDPMSDIGTAISYWIDPHDPDEMQLIRWGPTNLPGCPTRTELVERYAQQTGRDVGDIQYYFTFALFKTAVIAQQIYYRYHHGLTKDERFAFFIEATKILVRAADRAIETKTI